MFIICLVMKNTTLTEIKEKEKKKNDYQWIWLQFYITLFNSYSWKLTILQ